jgi:HK97 gp10 family phage protein
MSLQATINVVGFAELKKALIELGSEVAGKNGGFVRSALVSGALPVLRDAQARVPVKSGKLRKQIKRKRVKHPRHYNELVQVGVPLPEWAQGTHAKLLNNTYGKFVEMGTQRKGGGTLMPARPFLRPSLESNRQESVQIISRKLAASIKKAAKQIGNKNLAAVASKVQRQTSFIGPRRK